MRRAQAHNLYVSLVAQARDPAVFKSCQIDDSVDGRFDMIVLHLSLVLKRLKDAAAANQGLRSENFDKLSQELIGVYNNDMDRNLREMGVGDLSVGKHVKKMAKAFYGRLLAYDEALHAWDESKDSAQMCDALMRNIYRGDAHPKALKALLAHVSSYRQHLQDTSEDSLEEGFLPNSKKL